MSYNPNNIQKISDDQLDGFSNFRTAPPSFVADGQLTYDLQPLIYEQVTAGTGAIAHDATERCANLTAAATGDTAHMQSYQHYRYQAGRSQEIFITFNFNDDTGTTGLIYAAEYGDGVNNGIGFQLNGTNKQFFIRSNTSSGDDTVSQASWNIDELDGTGTSGHTLDTTKTQILVMDIQALYTGRVRVGFDIDGIIVWAHEFNHANEIAFPFIQTANLPIRIGITNGTGTTISEELNFICSCVLSRGGQDEIAGYDFGHGVSAVSVASGSRTHAMSIRPKTTFNSITNRIEIAPLAIDISNDGANTIKWELCLGDVLTGTTTFNDVNATYSSVQYNTAGTTSASPDIVIESGYLPATSQVKSNVSKSLDSRYPLTLTVAGITRADAIGTLTVLLTGIGGVSTANTSIHWKELR